MVAYKAHNLSGGVQVPLPQLDLFYKFILIVGMSWDIYKGFSEVLLEIMLFSKENRLMVMKKGGLLVMSSPPLFML